MNPSRAILPILAVTILGATVIWALVERPIASVDRPVSDRPRSAAAVPVDLGWTRLDDGTLQAEARLRSEDAVGLASRSEIRLPVITWDTRPEFVSGRIGVDGTSCVFRAPPDSRLIDNGYLAFARGEGCGAAMTGAPSGTFDLVLRFRNAGRVGLLADALPPAPRDPRWVTFSAADPSPDRPVLAIRARYAEPISGPHWRRIGLLAYQWQSGNSTLPIWTALVIALALVGLGAWLVCTGEAPDGSFQHAVRAAVIAGTLASGLGVSYAVLVPPLQAPDEPDHVLALAELTHRPALASDLAALAKLGHFNRIRFDAAERFTAAHVGQPADIAWGPEVFAHRIETRSATTRLWWKLLDLFTHEQGAGHTVVFVRGANALLFGVFLAAAAFLLALTTEGGAGLVVPLASLLVPTLPFFATHVSEFAVLMSAYVMAGSLVAGLFLDSRRSHLLGFPLGLSLSLIFASGRSGLPFAAIAAAALLARAIAGSTWESRESRGFRRAVVFWVGLGLGLGFFELLSTPEFKAGLWPDDALTKSGGVLSWAAWLRSHPEVVLSLPIAGLIADVALSRLRTRLLPRVRALPARAGLVLAWGAGLAAVASIAGSLILTYPRLALIENARPPAVTHYVVEVLKVWATSLRAVQHDFLLSASFWGGFGWVDTIPPAWFITLMLMIHAAIGVALLARIGGDGGWRRLVWLLALGAGWVAALALYAAASYSVNRNLHGRYLVGFYLSMLAMVWSVAGLQPRRNLPALRRVVGQSWPSAIFVLAVCLHAYALRFILLRYF